MDAPYFYVVRFAIAPEAEGQLLAWLDAGHSREVASQPGFLWAKRIKLAQTNEDGWPVYMNLYGLESADALTAYQADAKLAAKFAAERKDFAHALKADRFWGSLDAADWPEVAAQGEHVLVGRYVSPYTRRVAIAMRLYGLPFQQRALNTANNMDQIRAVNPMGRVPALVLPSGETLVESGAILDYLDELAGPGRALVPPGGHERRRVLQLVATATTAMDKVVALVYERNRRPADKQHQPWADHLTGQFMAALAQLEAVGGNPYLACERLTHADIATAVAFEFTRFMYKDGDIAERFPKLRDHWERCSVLPAFQSTALER